MATTAVQQPGASTFGGLVATVAALAAAGAGIVHLDAAGDHSEHEVLAAAFVAIAVAQLWWAGAAVAAGHHRRRVLAVGVLLHGSVLGLWGVSRTIGLPDVADGIGGVEPLGWSDVAASVLELTALAVVGLALALPAGAAVVGLTGAVGQRLVRGAAALTLAATVPAVLAPHAHGGGAHDDAELAGHGHGHDADATHPLAEVVHGHPGETVTATDGHAAHEGDAHAAVGPAADVAHAAHAAGEVHAPGDAHAGGDTHVAGATHVQHTEDAAGAPPAPPPVDPLAGPGQVSTLRVGPIPLLPSIPGVAVPHLSAALPYVGPGRVNLLPLTGLPAPCEDCFVLGIRPDLVYADGSPANLDTGPMLHHAVFTDHSRDDPVCGRDTLLGQMGMRVFAAGNERTGGVLPDGFGVPIERGPFGGIVELMNTSTQLRTVYIELAVRWVPRSTPGILPVTPVWLDVDSCSDSEVDVPAGPSEVVWEWPSSVTGRIVAAGGHLHDGGVWLRLANGSTAEHVCTSVAGYGARPEYLGTLDSMSTCAWDRLGTVRTGELLRLTARYNTAAPTSGVMGIMLAFVHETDDLGAGSPSPYSSQPPPDGAPPAGGHQH